MRDLISRIISTSLGTAGWWCFLETLLSHSKWCSYSFRSECSWESVGFSWKQHTYFRDLAWVWPDVSVAGNRLAPLPSQVQHTVTHRILYQSITSRLLRSLADLLLISGRDLNLWGSTSDSNAWSFWKTQDTVQPVSNLHRCSFIHHKSQLHECVSLAPCLDDCSGVLRDSSSVVDWVNVSSPTFNLPKCQQ